MSQFERVYKIDRLLRGRILPNKQRLLDELEVSEPTLKRDLEYMRSRLGAPITWDRQAGGYRYASEEPEFTLPGLWFSADEIHALLLIAHIIEQIQPSFLRDQLKPFEVRLKTMADSGAGQCEAISSRVRLIASPVRIANPTSLDIVVRATLGRRRIRIDYQSRWRGTRSEREISPGRLIYYRGNWYVDAWCHAADAPRRFAVDAIQAAQILATPARDIPAEPAHTGYGIYSGAPVSEAVLRFSATIAPWIRSSQWHPDQSLESLPDGRVLLRIPYSHHQEILMDVLRHGADVEVLGPETLRKYVAETLESAAEQYRLRRRSVSRATTSSAGHSSAAIG